MLDSAIIVGLVIIIVEILKAIFTGFFSGKVGKLVVPLLVFAFAGLFEIANGCVFGEGASLANIVEYLKDGFVLGASAGGIYSMGKSYLESSDTQ